MTEEIGFLDGPFALFRIAGVAVTVETGENSVESVEVLVPGGGETGDIVDVSFDVVEIA